MGATTTIAPRAGARSPGGRNVEYLPAAELGLDELVSFRGKVAPVELLFTDMTADEAQQIRLNTRGRADHVAALEPAIAAGEVGDDAAGGPHTATCAWASKKFHDDNPVLYKALMNALAEASEFIANEPLETAKPSRSSETSSSSTR